MFTQEGLEFACDELADTIDAAKGIINVEDAITKLIATICEQEPDVDGDKFRVAMLEKFNEIYKGDVASFVETCQWAHEIEPVENLVDDVMDGDTIPLEDLDEII